MNALAAALPADKLYALAPRTIAFYRNLRYQGDGMGVQIADFSPNDRALIARVYQIIADILDLLREQRDHPDVAIPMLSRFTHESGWRSLVVDIRSLGDEIPAVPETKLLRQVIHDLRGGGFLALWVYLQLIDSGFVQPADLHRMFFLARDQLKIMRNSVAGLDPAGDARDHAHQLHGVDLLIEKWAGSDHRLQERAAQISVDSHFMGDIAERCLEFSALDRVIYNLINNAVLNSADEQVHMAILPLQLDGQEHLRFVVANRVSAEQLGRLAARFPEGPGALFQGGFTTGGNGLGLRICADFICNAYGLSSVEQGLAEGHFGAALLDDIFAAWFHWPVAAE
jgi:signal transduction histidine kinase